MDTKKNTLRLIIFPQIVKPLYSWTVRLLQQKASDILVLAHDFFGGGSFCIRSIFCTRWKIQYLQYTVFSLKWSQDMWHLIYFLLMLLSVHLDIFYVSCMWGYYNKKWAFKFIIFFKCLFTQIYKGQKSNKSIKKGLLGKSSGRTMVSEFAHSSFHQVLQIFWCIKNA